MKRRLVVLLILSVLLVGCGSSRFQRQMDNGFSALDEGNYDGAVAAFSKAAEIDPQSAAACEGLGDALFARLDFGDAAAAYEDAVTLGGESTALYLKLADTYTKLEDGEKAAQYTGAALALEWETLLANKGGRVVAYKPEEHFPYFQFLTCGTSGTAYYSHDKNSTTIIDEQLNELYIYNGCLPMQSSQACTISIDQDVSIAAQIQDALNGDVAVNTNYLPHLSYNETTCFVIDFDGKLLWSFYDVSSNEYTHYLSAEELIAHHKEDLPADGDLSFPVVCTDETSYCGACTLGGEPIIPCQYTSVMVFDSVILCELDHDIYFYSHDGTLLNNVKGLVFQKSATFVTVFSGDGRHALFNLRDGSLVVPYGNYSIFPGNNGCLIRDRGFVFSIRFDALPQE